MSGSRAANNSAKKAAKRLAPHPANELRRAYEYLGRIEILEGALAGSPFVDVTALVNLAQQQLEAGNPGNAAALLEAAEHLCFAALAPNHNFSKESPLSPDLRRAITIEFEGLMRRAEEHWQDKEEQTDRRAIEELSSRTLDRARGAFTLGLFRTALEFARAVEVLSQIRGNLPATVPDRGLLGQLAS